MGSLSGVAFCHGRSHSYIPRFFRPYRVKWTFVDEDPTSHPDVVGNVFRWETLRRLGLSQYDIVLTVYCPTDTIGDIIKFLQSARALLKPGGICHFDNLVTRIDLQDFFFNLRMEWPAERHEFETMNPSMLAQLQSKLEALRCLTNYSSVSLVPEYPKLVQFVV
jgi:hypothetical protein